MPNRDTVGEMMDKLDTIKGEWPDVVKLQAWGDLVGLLKSNNRDAPISKKAMAAAIQLTEAILIYFPPPPPASSPCLQLLSYLGCVTPAGGPC